MLLRDKTSFLDLVVYVNIPASYDTAGASVGFERVSLSSRVFPRPF